MSLAAIIGNLLGYWTGAKFGPKLFSRPDSKFFKHEYVVVTQNFFEKHGPRAIVLARFVPVVRPLITSMAGVAQMNYRIYATYSTIGGILWVLVLTLAGYFFGGIDFVAQHIELVTLGIVALSLVPVVIEFLRHRRQGKG
jgi:membrane-associated protein